MNWQEGLSLFREILLLAATIGGVIVAGMGLNTWKKQLKGAAEWELARELLRSLYEVRDAIEGLRSRLITGGEMVAASERSTPEGARGYSDTDRNRTEGEAFRLRWRRATDARSGLDAAILEAEVLWGQEAVVSFTGLGHIYIELASRLETYLSLLEHDPLNELIIDGRRALLVGGDEEFEHRVEAALGTAEEFIRSKLKR